MALVHGVIEQNGRLLVIGDRLYAAVPYEHVGFWVYELKSSAPEYFVDAKLTYCTCPSDPPCKHLVALREARDNAT